MLSMGKKQIEQRSSYNYRRDRKIAKKKKKGTDTR